VGAIDERLCQIELAAITQVLCEPTKHPLQRSGFDPRLKPPVVGLIRRIATGQVCPRRTGPKDPHHAVNDIAWIAPWTPTLLRRSLPFLAREAAADRVPLLVGETLSLRSETRSSVDPLFRDPFRFAYLDRQVMGCVLAARGEDKKNRWLAVDVAPIQAVQGPLRKIHRELHVSRISSRA
jgi:hypothetical protein